MSSVGSIDCVLNKNVLPPSQGESIPLPMVDDQSMDDSYTNPCSLGADFLGPNKSIDSVDGEQVGQYGSLRETSPSLSPVFSDLCNYSSDILREQSEGAQKLRRKLMRNSNVLIIQGGYSGKQFIYERLMELGVHVYIMDGADSCWGRFAEQGNISGFIELDFKDHDTIYERALGALSDSVSQVRFDAVTTYYEDAVVLAARIATAFGVETNSVDACGKARSKRKTREVMASCGLPVPRFCKVVCEADVAPACDYVGYPLILKPSLGASSLGVTKANSKQEAILAYRNVIRTLNIDNDVIFAQGNEMIIEEFYDGEEFDIDILLSEGKVVYAKVSDNWACIEPNFQETGTNCPSCYAPGRQEELIKLSARATLALGFINGCFHVECRYTSRGPRLIEVNGRMGGVSVRDANLIAWGVDLVEEHCMAALKIPIFPPVPEKPLQYMAEVALNAPYSGTITSDEWLDFVKERDYVRSVTYMKKQGDVVKGPEHGMPDFIGEIIVVSPNSQEEATNVIRTIVEQQLAVPITPTAKSKQQKNRFDFPSHAHPFKTE